MFHVPVIRKLIQLLRMSRTKTRHHPPLQDRVIYEEKIFNRNHTFLFLALAVFFLYLAEKLGSDHYLPVKGRDMLFPFFLMLVIAVNFSVLRVRITIWGLFLRFGILHYETPWNEVSSVYIAAKGMVRSLRGWGVIVTSIEEGMRLSYSVPGKPKAVCRMRSKIFNEVAFSTTRPEIALTALKEGLGRSGKVRS